MTEQARRNRIDLERDERAWRAGRFAAFAGLALSVAVGLATASAPSPFLLAAWLLATPPVMLASMVLVEQVLRRVDVATPWGSPAPSPRPATPGAPGR